MKINQKVKKLASKEKVTITKREYYILSALAENEIREWTLFFNNLQNEYAKQNIKTKGVEKGVKRKGLGCKV